MPKVTMFISPNLHLTKTEIIAIGLSIRPLVADAASTKDSIFDPKTSIDFIPQTYPESSLIDGLLSFEIETAGKPERIEKLSTVVVAKLRDDIVDILRQISVFGKDYNPRQLVWIKFIDPRGPHI